MGLKTKPPGRPRDSELVARRSDEILDVAVEIFAREGYRRTDVQVIADALAVGKGTIYRYFPTKQELFLAAVDRGMRRLQATIRGAADLIDDPLEEIGSAVRSYLRYFDEHPEIVELIIQERAEFKDRKRPTYFVYRDASIERGREAFRHLMDEGRVRKMPVDRILDVLSDLLYGAIFTNYFAGRRKPFEEQAAEILDIVLHGILPADAQLTAPIRAGRTTDANRE
jgi:AcrR family transcriptional regulator